MAYLNPDTPPPPPINVSSNPVPEQAATAGRDIALVLLAVPALLKVLGSHSITAWAAYFQSNDFGQLVAAASPFVIAGIFAWRQWNARHVKAVKVELATAAPNATVDRKDIPTNA